MSLDRLGVLFGVWKIETFAGNLNYWSAISWGWGMLEFLGVSI